MNIKFFRPIFRFNYAKLGQLYQKYRREFSCQRPIEAEFQEHLCTFYIHLEIRILSCAFFYDFLGIYELEIFRLQTKTETFKTSTYEVNLG